MEWFSQHSPFQIIETLMSISTGVVGDNLINCHLSEEIGNSGLSKIIGLNFESVKFKCKERVLSLAAMNNTIKLGESTVFINTLILFQRMCIAKQSDDELKEYLKIELAPIPLSLFSEEGMRKGTKSSLYSSFTALPNDTTLEGSKINTRDGRYTLHKVLWQRNDTFENICESM